MKIFGRYYSRLDDGGKKAVRIIVIFGIISLLGDLIYEAARSVNGPYLQTLGLSATVVGVVAGAGELLGYAIRLASGYFSDRTKAYWLFTIVGYGMLITVPMLALTGVWQFVAVLIILERVGKGIRSPARDTILSHSAKRVGTGFGFAIAEFLDQIGATIGPLIFTFFFMSLGHAQETAADYRMGYGLLWLPFAMLMMVLFVAYYSGKGRKEPEAPVVVKKEHDRLSRTFWIYSFFTFATAMGFVSFAIVGYHLKAQNIVTDAQIPLFYAIAMVVDAVSGLIVGKYYDNLKAKHKSEHAGLLLLVFIPVVTALIPALVFSISPMLIIAGIILWGVVLGTHETIMKAGIADTTSIHKRGTGYGLFNTFYGAALFIGSSLAGLLYDFSIGLLVSVMIAIQIASIGIFLLMRKEIKRAR